MPGETEHEELDQDDSLLSLIVSDLYQMTVTETILMIAVIAAICFHGLCYSSRIIKAP